MFKFRTTAASTGVRLHHLVAYIAASLFSLHTIAAQEVRLLGGGCTVPSGGTPGVPDTHEEVPALGNPDFQVSFACPIGSTAMFVLIGRCLEGPIFPDFAEGPCGAGCGQRIDAAGIALEGKELTGQLKEGGFAMPVPEIPALVGVSICMQFLCFQIEDGRSRCREISQTLEIEFQ